MTAINMERVYQNAAIPAELKQTLANYSDDVLLVLASAMHGARISAAAQREKDFAEKAKAVKNKGVWDFTFSDLKIMVDLKSPGFDHNTPVDSWCKKYLDALPKGYTGIFVIQETTSVHFTTHWPIAKLAAHGLVVMTEAAFFERYL